MNDPYVMSAWGKASNITDDSILFLSDTDCKFSSRYGWAANGRTGRYAMIIDHGKIIYAKHESKMQEVSVSGPTAILDFLKDYKP
jgi:alkyl hydroperoxide reductase 1